MQPRVSTATVVLAVIVLSTVFPDEIDARPMHAAIVDKYHRYLEVKHNISAELDEWLMKYGPQGEKNGYIPVTESRSSDDALEDQRQRFYLTKEQIYEAREANPMAQFDTDGPFTLMTMDEFEQFLSNTHIKEARKAERPAVEKSKTLSEKEDNTPSTDESKNNDSKNIGSKNDDSDSKNKDTNKKTWAPATEGPTVIAAMRRLRSSGKSQYAFNGGDYSDNGERGFQSTSENYIQTSQQTYQSQSSQQTYQSESSQQTYQANTDSSDNGGNTNRGWNFGDVSTGDSAQVARVSGGTGSSNGYSTGNWWGTNGWGGNSWWSWGNGGSSAGSWSSQWTAPPESSNNQWPSGSSNNQWTPPPDNQWTEPSDNQQPATEAPQVPTTPAPPPVTDPPTPAPESPAPEPAPAPAPASAPAPTDPPAVPVTKAPVTPAPAPVTAAPAPAPVPATKKKAKTTDSTASDTATAKDADSDSVDWSKSACVNPPGLQGQCGSCWAFATVGALEAAQCLANGDKNAPSYSEQQLVSCDTKDYGCNGGAPVYAMEYVRDNGVCTKSSYPYTSVDGGTAAACTKSCTPTKSGIKEIVQLTSGDKNALLGALKKQPVIVSVVSNNPVWKQYKSGVITSCDPATVDHAVLAVGYDATSIKIKNSWGTDWGEDGYVRISHSTQDMGTCAVLTDMSYPKV